MEMNIYQRVNEVRKAIDYIRKDKSVSTGGGSYKAVTHDMVTAMVRDHMVKFGIICSPSLVSSHVSQTTTKDGAVSNVIRYEAIYDFAFINIDSPSEQIVIRIEAHANDNQDKAPGKAISYAKKYAVLKLFEIETGEDEESRSAQFDVITEEQLDQISALIKETSTDIKLFLKAIGEESLDTIHQSKFKSAIGQLETKKARQKNEHSATN